MLTGYDAWSRLLLHGLTEFWGLLSKSVGHSAQDQAQLQIYFRAPGSQHPSGLQPPARLSASDITCTDVLAAHAASPSGSITAMQLEAFVRTHVGIGAGEGASMTG